MANSWFRFKQFTIHQDRCAMKVGTDGVLLGALAGLPAADAFGSEEQRLGACSGRHAILDIGTGTGLVALMLAQRSSTQTGQGSTAPLVHGDSAPLLQVGPAQVDAVEIVAGAAGQAAENVAGSPWADRIRVIHQDFLDFYPSCQTKYDLIVSNPPYFRNSLKPVRTEKALARHGSTAFFRGLLTGSEHLLASSGKCCLILPAPAVPGVETMAAEVNLYVQERVNIRSKPGERIIRQLLTFGKARPHPPEETPHPVTERELVIYEREGQYSSGFAALARPFYLNL